MENEEETWYNRLHHRTYRQLQHQAKSMQLPSNFKKVYLIILILTKKFKSADEVGKLILKMKQERLQKSKTKKRNRGSRILQIPEPSHKLCSSPSIMLTPKRPSQTYVNNNPDLHKAVVPFNPRRSLLQQLNQNIDIPSLSASDRVLRSFNLKSMNTNYALIHNDIQDARSQCCSVPTGSKIKVITNDGRLSKINLTAKCYIRKPKPNITSSIANNQHLLLTNRMDLPENKTPLKRQRTISGIYPLRPEEGLPTDIHTNESVCLRKIDGSLTKINALVQKRNVLRRNYSSQSLNIQDIINNQINANLTESLQIANANNNNNDNLENSNSPTSDMKPVQSDDYSDAMQQSSAVENYEETTVSKSVYRYHSAKGFHNPSGLSESMGLPSINDVFAKFKNVDTKDLTQPLYVEITEELEIGINEDPVFKAHFSNGSTVELENLYNIPTLAPLVKVSVPAATTSVYSTGTVATPMMHPSTIPPPNDALNATSPPADDHSSSLETLLCEFYQVQCVVQRKYNQNQDVSSSSSSDTYEISQEEMFEDAFEIIGQDGDYMEQIGMGVRVQCIICPWAGPNKILHSHVRKEHTNQILKYQNSEWNITFTLESLVMAKTWLSQLVEYDSSLYVLSAKYEEPGNLMATLSSLSKETESVQRIGSITIYNKITGEPFSWNGQVQEVHQNMPHESGSDSLRVDLSSLDLIPNSANLKLVKGELVKGEPVTESPNRVVVGHPHLNDIHIILFVKVYD